MNTPGRSALSLFVLRILADDADGSFSLDDLALLTHRFYRRSDLHFISPPFSKMCALIAKKRDIYNITLFQQTQVLF